MGFIIFLTLVVLHDQELTICIVLRIPAGQLCSLAAQPIPASQPASQLFGLLITYFDFDLLGS